MNLRFNSDGFSLTEQPLGTFSVSSYKKKVEIARRKVGKIYSDRRSKIEEETPAPVDEKNLVGCA